MLNKMKKALKNNKGFTLIELIIVIAVVVLLAAITIPSYLNVVQSAKDAEVTSAARNAYLAVMVQYTENQVALASGSSANTDYVTTAETSVGIDSTNTNDSVAVTGDGDATPFEVTVTIDGRKATATASGVGEVTDA